MAGKVEKSWQCPPFTATAETRKGWINEQVQEAESWMKGQTAYQDIPTNIAMIAGRVAINQERSNLRSNYLKYCIRKIVSTLADVREIGTYGSDVPAFQKQAEQQNRVVKSIYLESQFSAQVRRALQFAMPTGSGYLWPKYKRDRYGMGGGNFVFESMGYLDVLPVQMDDSNMIQSAYACTLVKFMPIAEAHGRWPTYQAQLTPVAKGKYSTSVGNRRLDMAEMFRYGMESKNWADLYCEIHYTFVNDISINATGLKMAMGDPGTSWYYEVPSIGTDIPDGQGGMRKALPEDCMLYPQLRLLTSTPSMNVPMYDGTAYDWHGIIPAVRYSVDDWAWEPSPYSLVSDVASMEMAKQRIERGMDQVAKHRLDPSLGYDLNAGLADTKMEGLDPWEERIRMGVNGKTRDVVDTLLPQWLMEIPEWEFKYHELLTGLMEKQLGLNDIGNLANMKLNVQGDQADKMLSEIGPLAKDIEFGIECSNALVAKMLGFSVPQYMTTKRLMTVVGPDNVTKETFDYDPEQLIPSHMPEETASNPANVAVMGASSFSHLERGKRYARNLRLTSMKGNGHQLTVMQEQLKYLQLSNKPDFPLTPHTLAKKLGLENFGEIDGATEVDRWFNWQEKLATTKAKIQKAVMAEMPAPPQPPPSGGKQPTGGKNGRPASNSKPGQIVQKGKNSGAPRTTLQTS